MYYTPDLFSWQQSRSSDCRSASSSRRDSSRRKHTIEYSDKIYARLTMSGRTVAELTRDRVYRYSDLLAMLRAMAPKCRGLARLTIRNMTRGWSQERPLMLYPDPAYAAAASTRCIPSELH